MAITSVLKVYISNLRSNYILVTLEYEDEASYQAVS